MNQFFKNTEKILPKLDIIINNFSKSSKIQKYRKIPENTPQHYEIPVFFFAAQVLKNTE